MTTPELLEQLEQEMMGGSAMNARIQATRYAINSGQHAVQISRQLAQSTRMAVIQSHAVLRESRKVAAQ